jgi:hypothetical protein
MGLWDGFHIRFRPPHETERARRAGDHTDATTRASDRVHARQQSIHRKRVELAGFDAIFATVANHLIHLVDEGRTRHHICYSQLGHAAQYPARAGTAIADVIRAFHAVAHRMNQPRFGRAAQCPHRFIVSQRADFCLCPFGMDFSGVAYSDNAILMVFNTNESDFKYRG